MNAARVSQSPAKTPPRPSIFRHHPTVRTLARAWRELTGGTARDRDSSRKTLIACSGGADSSCLVLALAAAVSRPAELFVVAHIVHDLRPRDQALADRDASRDLADRLGLKFVESEVRVRAERGNAEAAARRLRYAALEHLATAEGCRFIAVAHHADDQLETMLMALIRGSGPQGLSGMPARRRSGSVKIIRPALGVTRSSMQDLCRAADWTWREDATNQDQSRLRAAIRHRIIPELESLRPGAARRASRSATLLRGAAGMVRQRVLTLLDHAAPGQLQWTRAALRKESTVTLGELLRTATTTLRGGTGKDRLSTNSLLRIARAIKDDSTEPRTFSLAGIPIDVTARLVTIGAPRD